MKLSDSKGIEAVYEIVMPRPLGVDRDLLGVDLSHTAWWRSLLEERNSSRGEPIRRQQKLAWGRSGMEDASHLLALMFIE